MAPEGGIAAKAGEDAGGDALPAGRACAQEQQRSRWMDMLDQLFHPFAGIGRHQHLSCEHIHQLGMKLRRKAFGRSFRSEEQKSEIKSLMRKSYDVFCLTKKILIS